MSVNLLDVETYLRTFESEYLLDLLPSGGSTVRFVTGSSDDLEAYQIGVEHFANRHGYHHVMLDTNKKVGETASGNPIGHNFHRLDKIYAQIAGTLDWAALAARQMHAELKERGIDFPGGVLTSDVEAVARHNDMERSRLLKKYENVLTHAYLGDTRMSSEFRTAITALGHSLVVPDEMTPTTKEVLLGWLRAEKALPGAKEVLSRIHIHSRINLGNVRFMLASLMHWLRKAGEQGLVLVLDFRPYERTRMTKSARAIEMSRRFRDAAAREAFDEIKIITREFDEESILVHYSSSAYIQMLELMRHFVDETERFEGFALLVMGSWSYFSGTAPGRKYSDYNALHTRIGMEVNDRNLQNPSAPLVHLGGGQR